MQKLSNYQKLSLKFYLAHKDKKLTVLSMYLFNAKLYAWLGILSVGLVLFNYLLVGPQAACVLGALLLGALARDIGTFIKSVRNWPLLQEIIDWQKAASMLEKAD